MRPGLRQALRETWDELARPGSWWGAADRRDLAGAARAAWSAAPATGDGLPAAAVEAATVIAARPASATEAWVGDIVAELGETRYVELVGVVARVTAVDTFLRLLGHEPEALPDPIDGPPGADPVPAAELRAVVDRGADPLLPGGQSLIALGRAAVEVPRPDRAPLEAVAAELGLAAAVDTAAVAANFQIMNRVVDATGLPVGPRRIEANAAIVDVLALHRFPHAGH